MPIYFFNVHTLRLYGLLSTIELIFNGHQSTGINCYIGPSQHMQRRTTSLIWLLVLFSLPQYTFSGMKGTIGFFIMLTSHQQPQLKPFFKGFVYISRTWATRAPAHCWFKTYEASVWKYKGDSGDCLKIQPEMKKNTDSGCCIFLGGYCSRISHACFIFFFFL